MTPYPLAVLKRICSVIATPTPGEPISIDLSLPGKVRRGQNLLGADVAEQYPVVTVLEAPRPDIAVYAGEYDEARHSGWTLLIQGFVEMTEDRQADPAYELCAIVEGRLRRIIASDDDGNVVYPGDFLLPLNGQKLITGLEITPSVVRPPEKGVSDTAFFFLPVRVGLVVKQYGLFVAD